MNFAYLSYERFHAVAVEDTRDDMERCMRTFAELLWQKGEDFKIENGQLLVGRYVINAVFFPETVAPHADETVKLLVERGET